MFTVLGEALLDMVQPEPGDLYRALPAGGPLNIAVALRRLGHPTAMMARFATGALGERLRQYAQDCDLDLSACVDTDQQATLAFATVDDQGRASYDFYVHDTADWNWSADELDALPPTTQAVHSGSLATALEPGASQIAAWWDRLAREGRMLLSFDPNVRPALAGPRDVAVRRVERLVSRSHVVKASDEDLGWLYPDDEPADAIRRWAGSGPAAAVLTRGPDGCLGALAEGQIVEAPAPSIAVADTIGAGDAFMAGLLSGLQAADRLDPEGVRRLTRDELAEAMQRALAVAAVTCSRAGANPPTRAELDSYLASMSEPTAASAGAPT